jgi:hypothetical protein
LHDILAEKGLQNAKEGIIFQSRVECQRFPASSFIADTPDEVTGKIAPFVSIIGNTLPKEVLILEPELRRM